LLAAHRAVDDLGDLGLEHRHQVLAHLVRLELLEELLRRPRIGRSRMTPAQPV
jgi:hypothetical protein